MNYNETVDRVIALLKEKEVCLSSQKSHRDCYGASYELVRASIEILSDEDLRIIYKKVHEE